MDLTEYSQNAILKSMAEWDVPKDFSDPMCNYLVHGFQPGGFFTSVLANDFARAIQRSHPSNTIPALKSLSGWISEYMPKEACGSYERVGRWGALSENERRKLLEDNNLIYTEKEETWLAISGATTQSPYFYS